MSFFTVDKSLVDNYENDINMTKKEKLKYVSNKNGKGYWIKPIKVNRTLSTDYDEDVEY